MLPFPIARSQVLENLRTGLGPILDMQAARMTFAGKNGFPEVMVVELDVAQPFLGLVLFYSPRKFKLGFWSISA